MNPRPNRNLTICATARHALPYCTKFSWQRYHNWRIFWKEKCFLALIKYWHILCPNPPPIYDFVFLYPRTLHEKELRAKNNNTRSYLSSLACEEFSCNHLCAVVQSMFCYFPGVTYFSCLWCCVRYASKRERNSPFATWKKRRSKGKRVKTTFFPTTKKNLPRVTARDGQLKEPMFSTFKIHIFEVPVRMDFGGLAWKLVHVSSNMSTPKECQRFLIFSDIFNRATIKQISRLRR